MPAVRRLLSLVLASLALLLLSLPAVATEEPVTESTVTETTAAPSEGAGVLPAVTIPPPESEEVTADWTYRYLIPTLLLLAVLVVIATTVQYFLRVVRNRYKVVE